MMFVQWLHSLDELLYEVMSWLVFFPVTLGKIVRRPLAMMRHAEDELKLPPDQQYRATLSPPVMLILTTLLSQSIGLAVDGTNPIVSSRRGLAGLVNDNTTLLLLRLVLFGIFALVLATWKVRRSGVALDRETLKPPFYAQCYAMVPFTLLAALGETALSLRTVAMEGAGAAGFAIGLLFYFVIQVRWFQVELRQSIGRSVLDATIGMIASIVIFVTIAVMFAR